ncbi:unnamed protein product [Soboliphyme baturini]|uniref:Uncharacterized protein n=1 Tax=Soboliphyme baturini TaxID=241478 RepID=A0A183IB08_9BILA|nr:unnamed protein product [Soboliphyme baturini]
MMKKESSPFSPSMSTCPMWQTRTETCFRRAGADLASHRTSLNLRGAGLAPNHNLGRMHLHERAHERNCELVLGQGKEIHVKKRRLGCQLRLAGLRRNEAASDKAEIVAVEVAAAAPSSDIRLTSNNDDRLSGRSMPTWKASEAKANYFGPAARPLITMTQRGEPRRGEVKRGDERRGEARINEQWTVMGRFCTPINSSSFANGFNGFVRSFD